MSFLIFVFFLVKFDLILSQCLILSPNSKNCQICSFEYYDQKFLSTFKIGLNSKLSLFSYRCQEKNITNITRNILIANEPCQNYQINSFDTCYENIIQAFEFENINIILHLFSVLNFFFTTGNHYILRKNVNYIDAEFFRRNLVDISMRPLNLEEKVTIFVKSNEFYIFVSKTLVIENINFDGDGIETLSFDEDEDACYNKANFSCCFSDLNDSCNLSFKILDQESNNRFYGFFTLEKLFDSKYMFDPLLIMRNCKFISFFPINLSKGWAIFITFGPLSGNLTIVNTSIENSYFPKSLLYYSKQNYDELFQLLNISTSLEYFQQEISFDSVTIRNYNYLYISSEYVGNFFLFSLMDFNGNIYIINNSFSGIFLANGLFLFISSNINGNLTIVGISIRNIFSTSLFYVNNIRILKINRIEVELFYGSNSLLILKNVMTANISYLYIENANMNQTDAIISQNSNFSLSECTFITISSQHFFDIESSNPTIYRNFFSQIFCERNFLNVFSSDLMEIHYSYIYSLVTKSAFIFAKSSNLIVLEECVLKKINVFLLFFFINIEETSVKNCVISNSSAISFWNSDYTCFSTKIDWFVIEENAIFSKIFEIFSSTRNISYLANNFYIRNNNFSSFFMIKMMYGLFVCTNCTITNNYFLNSASYSYAINFGGKTHFLYFANCYFQDNGVIEKKNYYLSTFENIFIIFFFQTYAEIMNCYFIVGKLIDQSSGFILAQPFDGSFQILNSVFLMIDANPNFQYKGIIIDNFLSANFINNSFINILCNDVEFYHSHGSVILSSASYSESKFLLLHFENNTFQNCSCLNCPGLVLLGIAYTFIKNVSFINLFSSFYGGSLFIFGGINVIIQGIMLENSIADEGSGMILMNVFNAKVVQFEMHSLYSRKNGIIFLKNILNFEISNGYASKLFTDMKGGFIFSDASNVFMINITINSSKALIRGAVIYLQSSNLNLNDSLFYGIFSGDGGGINVQNAINIQINNLIFIKNEVSGKGAALFLDVLKSFFLNNVSFIDCLSVTNGVVFIKSELQETNFVFMNMRCIRTIAYNKGSCIYFLSASYLEIKGLNISQNGPSPLFFSFSFKISLSFYNIRIVDTFVNDSIIFIEGLEIVFLFLKIENCIAPTLIELTDIQGAIKAVNFTNNTGIYAFDMQSSSKFLLEQIFLINYNNTNFQDLSFGIFLETRIFFKEIYIINAFSSSINVFLDMQEGIAEILNSSFVRNLGQIFQVKKMNISFISCKFQNNKNKEDQNSANELSVEGLNRIAYSIYIESCRFIINSGFSLKATGSLIIIFNNSIYESALANSTTYSIILSKINTFKIISTDFIGFNSGNLFIINENYDYTTQVAIENSYFFNISSLLGAALYFYGNMQIKLINSTFKHNKAYINEDEMSENPLQGIAPCIFFKSINEQSSSLEIKSSLFLNNNALFIGSTLFAQTINFKEMNNTFINNTDFMNFSTSFFAFPLKLNSKNESQIMEITSGKKFDLHLTLVDKFNKTLIFDNETVLIMKPSVSTEKKRNDVYIQNGQAIAKSGIFSFVNLLFKTQPNSSFTILASGNFFGLKNNLKNELNPQIIEKELNFYVRNCFIGEIILPDKSCFFCPSGTYSLIDPMLVETKYHKCFPCIDDCICYGGNYISPSPGFYRKTNMSLNAVKCMNMDSCLGGDHFELKNNKIDNFNEDDINGKCREGSSGTLCYYCDYGYGKYEKNDICKKCASLGLLIYGRLICYIILMASYILVNFVYAESSHIEKKSIYANFSTFLKIIINHSQHITIILSITDKNPLPSLKPLLDFPSYFSFSDDYVISNECLLQQMYYDKITNVIFKEFVNCAYPLLFSLVSFFMWLIINYFMKYLSCLKKFSQSPPQGILDFCLKMMLFILLSTFVFYSMIIKSGFSLFTCIKIDLNSQKTYLKETPDLECWSQSHIKYLTLAGFPNIFIWGLLFPFALFYILKKNVKIIKLSERKRRKVQFTNVKPLIYNFSVETLKETKIKDVAQGRKGNSVATQNFENKLKFSKYFVFFYKDYLTDYYYWECLIFVRKFLLSFFASLSKTLSEEYLINFMILLIFIFILSTWKMMPYKLNIANIIELFSLFVCWITIASTFALQTNVNQSFANAFGAISIIFNLIFFIISVSAFFLDCYGRYKILKRLRKRNYMK